MNRRKAVLGLAMGPLAATTMSFAQNGPGGGGSIGANLIGQVTTNSALTGSFVIQRFAAIGGVLQAIGVMTLTNGSATGVTTLALPVTIPADPPSSCTILHLVLGPITLDILGLTITTNQIVIDISAVPGPGNLLGNLLCDIAGLLNPGGTLTGILNQLVALLNQLLGAL